jgi:hypothetical protein
MKNLHVNQNQSRLLIVNYDYNNMIFLHYKNDEWDTAFGDLMGGYLPIRTLNSLWW